MYGTYCRLNVHVCAPWQSVVRAARGKLNKTAFRPELREKRKEFYRVMLKYHAEAYRVYAMVA